MPSIMSWHGVTAGRTSSRTMPTAGGLACLRCAVRRSGWSLYAFVFLTNHLHLVLKTPCPNLAKGMQLFLSLYANGWARRHRHCGHLFQGRYRTELVEDETYLWVLTRYVHLNPVRAGAVWMPEGWDMVESAPGISAAAIAWTGWPTTRCLRPGPASSGWTDPEAPTVVFCGGRSDYPACPPVGRGTAWMAPRQ